MEQPEVNIPPGKTIKLEAVGSGQKVQVEYAMAYCPRCSAQLAQRSCKMICPSCGYYMSCSDFY
jgi:Zn finger protein HypA/HybF involved in hydrogenase expression